MFSKTTIKQVTDRANQIGVDPAALLAVAEVESGGKPFWIVNGKSVPPARFEGHYFYRLLPKDKREKAVRLGLAHPKAGVIKNPRSYAGVYDLIERAARIDKAVAYMSSSWGVGQVMGENWSDLGYHNVFELVNENNRSVAGQVDSMVRFIQHNGLIDELQRHDWTGFARRYNGPGYRKNAYDTKMAQAYKRWRKALTKGDSVAEVAREAKHDTLIDIQKKLKRLGYYSGKIDGIEGNRTRTAVRNFQRDNGLKVDGKYGPLTERTVDEELRALDNRNADRALVGGAGTGVGAGGSEGMSSQLDQAADTLQTSSDSIMNVVFTTGSQILTGIAILLSLATVGLVLYGLVKKLRATRQVVTRDDLAYKNTHSEADEA